MTIERAIAAENVSEALSIAATALAQFAGSRFPPPDCMEIVIMDEARKKLAAVCLEVDLHHGTTSALKIVR